MPLHKGRVEHHARRRRHRHRRHRPAARRHRTSWWGRKGLHRPQTRRKWSRRSWRWRSGWATPRRSQRIWTRAGTHQCRPQCTRRGPTWKRYDSAGAQLGHVTLLRRRCSLDQKFLGRPLAPLAGRQRECVRDRVEARQRVLARLLGALPAAPSTASEVGAQGSASAAVAAAAATAPATPPCASACRR